ncbi:hypothetical protein ACFVVX_02875 [Kitasatospora sp. NPDC058170]|uniref:hypothetical protein n=1 Tax=Kitasatospora sp. NPDC058170 TaxID=3346364 RepID=UPI0036DAD0B1
MDEASEGSDMTHFIPWVFFAWAGILAAGLLAMFVPVKAEPAFQPKPAAPPAAPTPAPLPGESRFWTLPKHVIDWRLPLEGEANRLVRPYCGEEEVLVFAASLGLPDPVRWMDDATDAHRVLAKAGA